MSNIFRQIIRHAQATIQAEWAIGAPAVVDRLRAEQAFFYELETPEALTHQRSVRLLELCELVRVARGPGRRAAGCSFGEVQAALVPLEEAVRRATLGRGAEQFEGHAGAVLLALQPVFCLAQALEGEADTEQQAKDQIELLPGGRKAPAPAGVAQAKPCTTVDQAELILREATEIDSEEMDLEVLEQRMAWSSREWAKYVARKRRATCSNSTVVATEQFKKLQGARAKAKLERKQKQEAARGESSRCGGGRQKPRHRSAYNG